MKMRAARRSLPDREEDGDKGGDVVEKESC
jgi:hypothetical protein